MLGGTKLGRWARAGLFALGAAGALAVAVAPARAQTPFALRLLVEENRPTSLGTFRNVEVQGVTRQGDLLFTADLESVRARDDQALFLWTEGRIVRLIGRDNSAPGGKIRRILTAVVAPRRVANQAFLATVRDDRDEESEALFVRALGRLRRVVRVRERLDDGQFLGVTEGGLQINANGELLLRARLDRDGNGVFDPATDTVALYLYTGGRLVRLGGVGDTLLGRRVTQVLLGDRSLNDRGRVAWEATLDVDGAAESVIVVSDRDRDVRFVRSGDRALGGRILGPRGPILNEPGNVGFVAELDVNGDGRFDADRDETGAFLFQATGTPPIFTLLRSRRLERGQSLIVAVRTLNDRNVATVLAQVDTNRDGRLDPEDLGALYLAGIGGVAALAREGARLPVGGDPRGGDLLLDAVLMNNANEVAIAGRVVADREREFDPIRDANLLLFADANGPVAVVRDGHFFGSSSFGNARLRFVRGPLGFTDAGVLVFTADLDRNFDGRIDPENEGRGVLLAIPIRD